MTDAQFYNVMVLTAASQVLAIVICWLGTNLKRMSDATREGCILIWLILTVFLPYLETGINWYFRGVMFLAIIWAACTFTKYFRDDRCKAVFYIQLFISYLAAVGYLLAALERC